MIDLFKRVFVPTFNLDFAFQIILIALFCSQTAWSLIDPDFLWDDVAARNLEMLSKSVGHYFLVKKDFFVITLHKKWLQRKL